MVKSFFSGLLGAVLNAALKGAASASDGGGNLQTIGVSAGAAGLAGLLGYILSHPATASAVTSAAVQSVVAPVPAPPA